MGKYDWIKTATEKDINQLRSVYYEAKEESEKLVQELKQEQIIMNNIGALTKQLETFEEMMTDLQGFRIQGEDPEGDVIYLKKIQMKMNLTIGGIEKLELEIEDFKKNEARGLTKSKVMQSQLDHIKRMNLKIKEILRLN